MDVLDLATLPPLPVLREQWRSQSLQTAWLYSDDWYQPEVDALLRALTEGRPGVSACLRLGHARAGLGCGISEAIDDLMCLFGALDVPTPPELVRALSIGWANGEDDAPRPSACEDPDTGLHTVDYLAVRLRELYGRPAHASTSALLLVDVGVDALTYWQGVERSSGVGHLLRRALPDGHPVADLGAGRYAVLVEDADDLATVAAHLSTRLSAGVHALGLAGSVRLPARTWGVDLPDEPGGIEPLLTRLRD